MGESEVQEVEEEEEEVVEINQELFREETWENPTVVVILIRLSSDAD